MVKTPNIDRLADRGVRFERAYVQYLPDQYDDGGFTGGNMDRPAFKRLMAVTRARITQIMNLLMLAPDIQEAILFLPRVESGRDLIHLRQLQPIALVPDWRKQRRLWKSLASSASCNL